MHDQKEKQLLLCTAIHRNGMEGLYCLFIVIQPGKNSLINLWDQKQLAAVRKKSCENYNDLKKDLDTFSVNKYKVIESL